MTGPAARFAPPVLTRQLLEMAPTAPGSRSAPRTVSLASSITAVKLGAASPRR